MKDITTNQKAPLTGMIGEFLVMVELAKRGVFAARVDRFLRFDILTREGIKIEVKTAIIGKKRKLRETSAGKYNQEFLGWQFNTIGTLKKDGKKHRLKRLQLADFYIFVCLDKHHKPIEFFIIPHKELKPTVYMIHLDHNLGKLDARHKTRMMFNKYSERWDLIT